MAGEARAKAEFASASRRIAADFDTLRETAKNEHARARSEAARALEVRQAEGRQRAHRGAEARRVDAMQLSDSFRDRLAALAADYGKFKLNPDLPGPSRESYDEIRQTRR